MRVLSWNLGAAFGPYKEWHDRAWHWIAAVDPDVALLQECVPPPWARERWTILTLPFTHWASAIVAKPEVGLASLDLDPDSLLGRFGSYLATGEVPMADGGSLLVASVHTRAAEAPDWVTAGHDRRSLARASVEVPWSNDVAFAGYRELDAGRRFLIGGDWNTARYLDEAGIGEPAGAEFFDRARAADWSDVSIDGEGHESRSWFGPGGPRSYQPDHLFADPATAAGVSGFAIDSYPVVALGLSDHAPLILDLDLSLCRAESGVSSAS
jgi:exonuclease III